MDNTSIAYLVGLFLGLGAVTTFIMGGLKKLVGFVDALPPIVKSVVVYVLALIITWVGKAINLNLPTDIHMWDIPVISSLLTAFVSYGWHALVKALQGKTTNPNASTRGYGHF